MPLFGTIVLVVIIQKSAQVFKQFVLCHDVTGGFGRGIQWEILPGPEKFHELTPSNSPMFTIPKNSSTHRYLPGFLGSFLLTLFHSITISPDSLAARDNIGREPHMANKAEMARSKGA